MSGRTMSDEFRSLDEGERAALEAALKRCRVLADEIESILRNESRDFIDRAALADFYASLQRAADVLGNGRLCQELAARMKQRLYPRCRAAAPGRPLWKSRRSRARSAGSSVSSGRVTSG
jgi:hypothetical protein